MEFLKQIGFYVGIGAIFFLFIGVIIIIMDMFRSVSKENEYRKMYRDAFDRSLYKMTREEAWEKEICIRCKRTVHPANEQQYEYYISAVCDPCVEKNIRILEGRE
jgi:hypothetical protein